ncbi:MAG: RDD family protein [Acidimicrobiales bacterium]|nr:RDD family protein [Acidimicrobiales bacterium]
MTSPPPPPPPAPTPGPLEPVGLGTRFGAKLIDWIVLFVPSMVLAVVFGGAATAGFRSEITVRDFIIASVATLLTFAYFVVLESSRGQTVGKMAVGIKVVGPDGHPPTMEVAARRNVWSVVSLVPILGDIVQLVLVIVIAVTISNGPFNRGWHDNFAGGTAVVRK